MEENRSSAAFRPPPSGEAHTNGNGEVLAVRLPEERLSVFDPRWMDVAQRMATTLARSGLVPAPLRNKPADVLLVLMKGYELGIQPIQALSELHVIDGKAGMSSALLVGQCVKHPAICKYFSLLHSDERLATYETLRAGAPRPVQLSFTAEDASKAGLLTKANWTRHRAAMLRARCASALARAVYPDLCAGLYTTDELANMMPQHEMEAPSPHAAESDKRAAEVEVAPVGTVPGGHPGADAQSDESPVVFPAEEVGPELVPSLLPPEPPSGKVPFDRASFLAKAVEAKTYQERLRLTKDLYKAMGDGLLTPAEAEGLRKEIQGTRE